jgi:hypothetical protein
MIPSRRNFLKTVGGSLLKPTRVTAPLLPRSAAGLADDTTEIRACAALLEEKSEQQRTGTIALKRNFPLERGSSHGDRLMCDYSLSTITSRPAKVGDNLVTTVFFGTYTRGFAAVGDPEVAVCLLPGTELVFEHDVERGLVFKLLRPKPLGRAARFRQINQDQPNTHHDAVEFPNGEIILVTALIEGQKAAVLQLPVAPQTVTRLRQPVTDAQAYPHLIELVATELNHALARPNL